MEKTGACDEMKKPYQCDFAILVVSFGQMIGARCGEVNQPRVSAARMRFEAKFILEKALWLAPTLRLVAFCI